MTTLRRLLVRDPLILMSLVLTAVVVFAGFGFTRAAWKEAETRVEAELNQVSKQLDFRFAEMERLAESIGLLWESGRLDPAKDQACWEQLAPWVKPHAHLTGLNLIQTDGLGFGMGRVGPLWAGRGLFPEGSSWRYGPVLGDAAEMDPSLRMPGRNAVDLRTRPWFQLGLQVKQATWTEVVLFTGRRAGQPGIFLVRPVRNREGRLLGVLSLDLLLESITKVVWEVRPTPGAWLMAIDERGRIIVPPQTHAMGEVRERESVFLRPVAPDLFPLAQDLFKAMQQQGGGASGIRAVREGLHGRIRPLARADGPSWHLVLALPEADINVAPRRRALLVGGMGLVMVGLFAALAFHLTRRVAHPLDQLAKSAEALTRGEPPPVPRTSIREIGILGATLEAAHRGLAEREALQAQLRHSHRMQAVGTLAGGIAHDLNNQLAAILTQLELGLTRIEPDQPSHRNLLRALEATQRCADTTKALLSFSRPSKPELQALDLNQLVEDTLGLLTQLLGPGIKVETDLLPWPAAVLGDWTQLEQVLVNLLLNARDALPAGGTIQVWTSCEHGEVRLQVVDNGTGMTPEVMEQVFDPFFTTKDVGKGTGLGLASALGVAQAHGGQLLVESAWGKGSCFTLSLPQTQVPLAAPVTALGQPYPDLAGFTFLVVDDEEALRSSIAEVLESCSAQVQTASDGEEAWDFLQKHSVDLIVTDQLMPRCTGAELLDRLRASGSQVPILILSGRGLEGMEADLAKDPRVAHLAKPFTISRLLEAVGELLRPIA